MKQTPHQARRSDVHSYFLIIIFAMLLYGCFGCSPRYGCPNMAYKKGKFAWIKSAKPNQTTARVTFYDSIGSPLCYYYEPNYTVK